MTPCATSLDDVFDDQVKEYKDVILITDGEDHDSFPVEAAEAAGERGVRLIAIGLGDENEGRRIPVTDENGRKTFLKHNGQEVWSQLDADTLRKMVNATDGGRYLNVATGTFDLGEIYHAAGRLGREEGPGVEDDRALRGALPDLPRPCAGSVFAGICDIGTHGKRNHDRCQRILRDRLAAGLRGLCVGACRWRPRGGSRRRRWWRGAMPAYAEGGFDEALSLYDEASVDDAGVGPPLFQPRRGPLPAGGLRCRRPRTSRRPRCGAKDPDLTTRAKFNLGNCAFRQAQRQRDSDLEKAIEHLPRRASPTTRRPATSIPDYREAAENIEIVRLYVKVLLDEQKKQAGEQEQQQQEEQENLVEKLKKLIERQNRPDRRRTKALRAARPDAARRRRRSQSSGRGRCRV